MPRKVVKSRRIMMVKRAACLSRGGPIRPEAGLSQITQPEPYRSFGGGPGIGAVDGRAGIGAI